jgi:hypothetical protein
MKDLSMFQKLLHPVTVNNGFFNLILSSLPDLEDITLLRRLGAWKADHFLQISVISVLRLLITHAFLPYYIPEQSKVEKSGRYARLVSGDRAADS